MAQLFFEGFFLQASLIFALGAQNLYVLESGLNKRHRIAVSVTCFLCDLLIIMMGVMGMGVMLKSYPGIKIVFGVLGIGFMLHYALRKLSSKDDCFQEKEDFADKTGLGKSVLKAITFSIINPHAYLDGIVLIGGYATKYPDTIQRVSVGMGASLYSLVWFLMLSNATSSMKPLLMNGKRMRLVMGLSGVVLLFLSFKLSVDVYDWVLETWEADTTIISGN